ncbi:hypothetical protein [Brucella anthropi]|uniref:Uncharacterized protein n=1 Tax=Brucella anthropi (strain ATCC 49188 / DSM 6882 / CCUG 24695 / JCM 21032 / LMG 3331 / NBRC 15819 / NCTC 12168 / Alc 37) TaxID=439375 RepID=A6X8C3_BRUA4|nr:hypothetical protein [Brucella anthropi]ABS17477.1 hypothetical protein Oant_4708 [Brucella anthropi ATCC 49188]AIK41110.1 hypothetical protein DR92_4693 [Brucella anthropi]KAB2727706.1 hypothetical protein F9K90_22935 [Brucella anthropi]KAB2743525.1 hypothetical protein F9K95_23545 [Brucella anthropi]KAB2774895.1 hypothetical protein F9K99_23365 [Brucella anthropi]
MRICHGTSSIHLDSILREGLKPRGQKPSNWQASSHADLVYLSQAYALHYAGNAADKEGGDILLVEIDTDLLPASSSMLADEDAILSALSMGIIERPSFANYDPDLALHDVAELITADLDKFAEIGADAEWSLSVIGNCTHHGVIPPDAITRIVSYSAEANWWIGFNDPVIAIPNFRYLGGEFTKTQLCLMGRKDEAEPIPTMFPMTFSLNDLDDHIRGMKKEEWHRVNGRLIEVY